MSPNPIKVNDDRATPYPRHPEAGISRDRLLYRLVRRRRGRRHDDAAYDIGESIGGAPMMVGSDHRLVSQFTLKALATGQ